MAKREPLEPAIGDKRYARRADTSRFEDIDDVGRSSAADQRGEAMNSAKRAEGDNGDRAS